MENFTAQPSNLFFFGLALLVLFGWYFATESERRKRNIGTILLLLIGLLCAVALIPLDKKL